MRTFFVRDPENDDEWTECLALDAEAAAEQFTESVYDGGGGEHFDSLDVEVRDPEGVVTLWTVEVDYSPSFGAYVREAETS